MRTQRLFTSVVLAVAAMACTIEVDYTGTYDVTIYAGTIGGTAVREVGKRTGLPGDTWHSLVVELPATGEHFVYVEVHQPSPDRMAWSAPIWVERI